MSFISHEELYEQDDLTCYWAMQQWSIILKLISMTDFLPQLYSQLLRFWWVIGERFYNLSSCSTVVKQQKQRRSTSLHRSQINRAEWTNCLGMVSERFTRYKIIATHNMLVCSESLQHLGDYSCSLGNSATRNVSSFCWKSLLFCSIWLFEAVWQSFNAVVAPESS